MRRGRGASKGKAWTGCRAQLHPGESSWSTDWESSGWGCGGQGCAVVLSAKLGRGWGRVVPEEHDRVDIEMAECTGRGAELAVAFSLGSGIGPGCESWLPFLAAV